MRAPVLTLAAVVGFGLASTPARLQQNKSPAQTSPYELVENWPQPFAKAGYVRGSQPSVFAESPDRIFLLSRGELKLPETLPLAFNGTWGSLGERAPETVQPGALGRPRSQPAGLCG